MRSPPLVEISTLDLREALRQVVEAAAASTTSKQALARLLGVRPADLARVAKGVGARI